jgi:hypothetical protein
MAKASRFTNGLVVRDGRPNAAANSTTETKISQIMLYSVTINPASVASATSAEQTFTVTGLAVGDVILAVNKPTATAGVGIVNMRVSAADTLALTFMNSTAGAVDPASETYLIVAMRATAN